MVDGQATDGGAEEAADSTQPASKWLPTASAMGRRLAEPIQDSTVGPDT